MIKSFLVTYEFGDAGVLFDKDQLREILDRDLTDCGADSVERLIVEDYSTAWTKIEDRWPERDRTVLLETKTGDVVVGNLDKEFPTHEESFEPYYYWYSEHADLEWDDVVRWALIPK